MRATPTTTGAHGHGQARKVARLHPFTRERVHARTIPRARGASARYRYLNDVSTAEGRAAPMRAARAAPIYDRTGQTTTLGLISRVDQRADLVCVDVDGVLESSWQSEQSDVTCHESKDNQYDHAIKQT